MIIKPFKKRCLILAMLTLYITFGLIQGLIILLTESPENYDEKYQQKSFGYSLIIIISLGSLAIFVLSIISLFQRLSKDDKGGNDKRDDQKIEEGSKLKYDKASTDIPLELNFAKDLKHKDEKNILGSEIEKGSRIPYKSSTKMMVSNLSLEKFQKKMVLG